MKDMTKAIIKDFKWFIANLLPRIHWTTITVEGKPHFYIWRQWLNHCWDVDEMEIVKKI